MNDEERLRQRIVLALDALPVTPAGSMRWERAGSRPLPGFALAPLAIGATLLVVLVLAAQLVLPDRGPVAAPAIPSFRDDFSHGIDGTKWTTAIAGFGPTVVALDGRAELSIPANARAGADSRINASLDPRNCVARGDYVVSVDYELLDWPSLSGASLLLHEIPPPGYAIDASIERFQNGNVESVTGHSQVDSNTIPITGSTGSLRLARRGTNVTPSYRVGNGPWKDIPVKIASTGDATFRIALLDDEFHFGGQAVRVAVDNFTLTATQLTCG